MPASDIFSHYTHTCLELFIHSIRECHRYGANKWGITIVNERHHRLVMGNLIVATLESGTTWFAIDIPTEPEQARLDQMINWGWTPQYQYKRPASKSGYYWPMEWKPSSHEKCWPIIQRLHDRYLAKVAAVYKQLRKQSRQIHSDDALVVIEQALVITLPRPSYSID